MVQTKAGLIEAAAIGTPELADNATTLAKLAGGTAGGIIAFDASGNPSETATGTAGQVMTSNGAGAAPTMQTASGGAWTLIASASASASSSIDFTTGIDATFDTYVILAAGIVTSLAATIELRTSNNGGSTFDSGAADYQWRVHGARAGQGSLDFDSDNNADSVNTAALGAGNTSGLVASPSNFEMRLHSPSTSSARTVITGSVSGFEGSNTVLLQVFAGTRKDAQAVDAVQIILSTGTFTSGNFQLYGIKKS